MVLKALDSSFALIGELKDTTNIRWIRRHSSPGEFSIVMPAANYSNTMKYIYTPDRRETGIIQKPEYTDGIKGKEVILSGFFLEKVLDKRVIVPTCYANGNIETAAREMVTAYQGDLGITLGTAAGIGTTVSFQETGAELGRRIYELLATQEMTFSLDYNYLTDAVVFNVWQGKDRTQDQTVNNFVCFSAGFKNLTDTKYTYDESNYKNYAVVGGQGEGADRVWVDVDARNGTEQQIQIYIDAKDLEQGESTLSEYQAMLAQRGLEKLLDYRIIQQVSFTPLDTNFKYLADYDLGDKVDVVLEGIGEFSARIEQISELWKQNNHTIDITVGTLLPTLYQKIRIGGRR